MQLTRLFWTAPLRLQAAVYRLTGGDAMGMIHGAPVLLLTTTGHKTGKRRTVPLPYFEDDGDYVIVASAGGAHRLPSWYLNLQRDPSVSVQVRTKTHEATARVVSDEERARLLPRVLELAPGLEEYEELAEMHYPVVVLTPKH